MKIIIVKQNILFLLKKKKKAKYSLILFIKISVCFRSTCIRASEIGPFGIETQPSSFFFERPPLKSQGLMYY